MNTYEGSVWLRGRRLSILEEMEEPGDYTPEERLGSALASMDETILCLIGKNSSGLPGIMGQATTALKIQGLMDAIRNERDQLRARVAELDAEVKRLKAPRSAKVKPDWKMPVPLQCLHCRNPLPPTASLVSDGEWILSWDDPCRFCHVPSTSFRFMRDIDWPFVDTHATAADFEALGFRVEVSNDPLRH